MLLETLEHATDELTSANLKAQSLLTDFSLECGYAKMDGLTPPTEFTEQERQQLKSALIATREALNLLTQLEGGVKS